MSKAPSTAEALLERRRVVNAIPSDLRARNMVLMNEFNVHVSRFTLGLIRAETLQITCSVPALRLCSTTMYRYGKQRY